MIPPPGAQCGIISDIDDTVVHTDAAHLLKMARIVFLNNSRTRLPFEGVAAFYQALQKGTQGAMNPLFYVTSSSWNIYDLLVDFFQVRGLPMGPLMMVDLGLTDEYMITPSHHQHKVSQIHTIMDTYPNLPFILIGDSGQRDPEVYLQVVTDYPGRIPAVYIRDVAGDQRDEQIHDYIQTAAAAGTEMLLVKDTAAASLHATQKGFILPETLPDISQDRHQDQQAPDDPIEKLLDPKSV
jgi:phosphatidate phosphatase APP1